MKVAFRKLVKSAEGYNVWLVVNTINFGDEQMYHVAFESAFDPSGMDNAASHIEAQGKYATQKQFELFLDFEQLNALIGNLTKAALLSISDHTVNV